MTEALLSAPLPPPAAESWRVGRPGPGKAPGSGYLLQEGQKTPDLGHRSSSHIPPRQWAKPSENLLRSNCKTMSAFSHSPPSLPLPPSGGEEGKSNWHLAFGLKKTSTGPALGGCINPCVLSQRPESPGPRCTPPSPIPPPQRTVVSFSLCGDTFRRTLIDLPGNGR